MAGLEQVISNISSLLGGYTRKRDELRQQQAATELAQREQARREAESAASIEATRASIEASRAQTLMAQKEYERKMLADQATTMATQLSELREGIRLGAIDPDAPETKAAMNAIWTGYRPILEKLVPGYTPPANPFDIKRMLSAQELESLSRVIQRVDVSDPETARLVAEGYRIPTAVVQALGRQRLTAGEEAEREIALRQLEARRRESEGTIITNTIQAASQNPVFLNMSLDDQRQYMSSVLGHALHDPERGDEIAQQLPRLKDAVDAATAARLAASVKTTQMELASREKIAARQLEAERAMRREEIAARERAAARAGAPGEAAPSPEWEEFQRLRSIKPETARKNIISLRKELDDLVKRTGYSPEWKANVVAAIADNMSALSTRVTNDGRYITADTLRDWISVDVTPTRSKKSLETWKKILANMQANKIPPEFINWFYRERYAHLFGPKNFAAKAPAPAKAKKR